MIGSRLAWAAISDAADKAVTPMTLRRFVLELFFAAVSWNWLRAGPDVCNGYSEWCCCNLYHNLNKYSTGGHQSNSQ
jgi:hypothetical protein